MNAETYRDMSLLNEVTQSPDITQRALAKRIGAALGLTNLMLRRLTTKGYIKVVNVQKSWLRYLITPQGVMEKARLTREYIEYSLFFYRNVRTALHGALLQMIQQGHRRVLLWGTGELAEIAFLTVRELGLDLVGIVDDAPAHAHFLGYHVQSLGAAAVLAYDRLIAASLEAPAEGIHKLLTLGVPAERLITLPVPGVGSPWLEQPAGSTILSVTPGSPEVTLAADHVAASG